SARPERVSREPGHVAERLAPAALGREARRVDGLPRSVRHAEEIAPVPPAEPPKRPRPTPIAHDERDERTPRLLVTAEEPLGRQLLRHDPVVHDRPRRVMD